MSVPGITTVVDPARTASSRTQGSDQKSNGGALQGGTPVPAGGKPMPLEAVSLEAIHAAAAAIEQHLRESGRQLAFRVDEASGKTVVTVTNSETGEVVRQFPSEEVLRIARDLATSQQRLISEFA